MYVYNHMLISSHEGSEGLTSEAHSMCALINWNFVVPAHTVLRAYNWGEHEQAPH